MNDGNHGSRREGYQRLKSLQALDWIAKRHQSEWHERPSAQFEQPSATAVPSQTATDCAGEVPKQLLAFVRRVEALDRLKTIRNNDRNAKVMQINRTLHGAVDVKRDAQGGVGKSYKERPRAEESDALTNEEIARIMAEFENPQRSGSLEEQISAFEGLHTSCEQEETTPISPSADCDGDEPSCPPESNSDQHRKPEETTSKSVADDGKEPSRQQPIPPDISPQPEPVKHTHTCCSRCDKNEEHAEPQEQLTELRSKECDLPPPDTLTADPLPQFSKTHILVCAGLVFLAGMAMMLVAAVAVLKHEQGARLHLARPTRISPAFYDNLSTAGGRNINVGDMKAAAIASDLVGIKSPPDTFVFKDTSDITSPKRSFSLISEAKNLSYLFVEWPNQAPIINPEEIYRHPPFYDVLPLDDHSPRHGKLTHVTWQGGSYHQTADDTEYSVEVGVFDPRGDGTTIVYVATPLTGTDIPDMDYAASVVEGMLSGFDPTQLADDDPEYSERPPLPPAPPEAFAAYRRKLAELISTRYKPPRDIDPSNSDVSVDVSVDEKGNITELELRPNQNDEINNAIQHAIDPKDPLPAPPRPALDNYSFTVRAHGATISVDER